MHKITEPGAAVAATSIAIANLEPPDTPVKLPSSCASFFDQAMPSDTPLSLSEKLYVIMQLTVISWGIFVMMHNIDNLVIYQHFSIGLTLAFALYSLGKVQESDTSALLTELIKYGLLMLNLVWLTTTPLWLSLTTLTIGLLSLIWLYTIYKQNNEMQAV